MNDAAETRTTTGRTLARAVAIVAATFAVYWGSRLAEVAWFCPSKVGPARAARGDAVLPSDGFEVALASDTIGVCTYRHCARTPMPGACHDDVACICFAADPAASAAPAAPDDAELARRFTAARGVAATCTVDERHPRTDDRAGRCPRARCVSHVDAR